MAADVSHRFLIRRVNELVAQREPTAQLWRSLFYRTRPALAGESSFNFCKRRVLS